jgi:hypothetical protein
MGIAKNQQHDKKDARGKARNVPLPWAGNVETPEADSWDDVEGYLIAYVVQAVGGAGGSVQFTVTRDGGALGVRVYDDAIATRTEWARVGDGLEDLLYRIGDYYRQKAGKETQRW